MEHLADGLKKHWPYVEGALTEVVDRLLPVALNTYGSDSIRAALNKRAQVMLEESLASGEEN